MMKNNVFSKINSIVVLSLVFIFIYAPIIAIMIFSFNDSRNVTSWEGFTLNWYENLFQSDKIMRSVLTTFEVAILATLISLIIGTLAAIALVSYRKRSRNAILMINDLPIINPDIITAVCFFLLIGVFAIPGGFGTLLMAHVAFCVPYVVITIYPKVRSLDPNLAEAARDLGANSFKIIFKVLLPQISGSIVAAAAISFAMSFDDFVISYFAVGSSGVENISMYLYSLRKGVDPTVNALTTIMIGVVVIVVVSNYFITNFRKKGEE